MEGEACREGPPFLSKKTEPPGVGPEASISFPAWTDLSCRPPGHRCGMMDPSPGAPGPHHTSRGRLTPEWPVTRHRCGPRESGHPFRVANVAVTGELSAQYVTVKEPSFQSSSGHRVHVSCLANPFPSQVSLSIPRAGEGKGEGCQK